MESEVWTLDGKKSTKIILTIAHLDHDKSTLTNADKKQSDIEFGNN
jgi:translation elongation factor EF-Tu-like GTPase